MRRVGTKRKKQQKAETPKKEEPKGMSKRDRMSSASVAEPEPEREKFVRENHLHFFQEKRAVSKELPLALGRSVSEVTGTPFLEIDGEFVPFDGEIMLLEKYHYWGLVDPKNNWALKRVWEENPGKSYKGEKVKERFVSLLLVIPSTDDPAFAVLSEWRGAETRGVIDLATEVSREGDPFSVVASIRCQPGSGNFGPYAVNYCDTKKPTEGQMAKVDAYLDMDDDPASDKAREAFDREVEKLKKLIA